MESNSTSTKRSDACRRWGRRLAAWLVVAVSLPNFILAFTEPVSLPLRLADALLAPSLWWLIASRCRRPGVLVWAFFPLMFLGAFQIVLLWLYGRSVIAVDMFLNLLTTNPSEAGELLGNLWPSIVMVVVVYLPALVGGCLLWHCRVERGRALWPAMGLIIGAAMLLLGGKSVGDALLHDVYPVNVLYNLRLSFSRVADIENYPETSRSFRFDAVSERPDSLAETYVLVIGETSRADRWQILNPGSPLKTNPCLSRRLGHGLTAFPNTLSESNTTHKSVPLLLSHLTARHYADSLVRVKSLVTAFREAGFYTVFISNQRPNNSFIDRFAAEADSTIYIEGVPTSDLRLLDAVDSLRRARKTLIVLHSYGSHFSYRDRYDGVDLHPRFLPDDYTKASASDRTRLLNAYDNTIVLTDSLLSSLISRLEGQRCAGLIYTADHGENIFDNGSRLFLHASPFPTLEQLHVPFLVWMTPWLRSRFDIDEALDMHHISSSEAFFHTAIQMAGIDTPYLDRSRSALDPEAFTGNPVFLDDHNRAIPLASFGIVLP